MEELTIEIYFIGGFFRMFKLSKNEVLILLNKYKSGDSGFSILTDTQGAINHINLSHVVDIIIYDDKI